MIQTLAKQAQNNKCNEPPRMFLVHDGTQDVAQFAEVAAAPNLQVVVADGNFQRRLAIAEGILPQSGSQERKDLAKLLAELPCWFCTPDGVAGPLTLQPSNHVADLSLLLREAVYHHSLQKLRLEESSLEALKMPCHNMECAATAATAATAARLLGTYGAVVLEGFLGAAAQQLASEDFGEFLPACSGEDGEAPARGSGRGDWAVLPENPPMRLLEALDALDALVMQLKPLSQGKLDFCEFRTWPMVTAYYPGMRYTWHVDNGKRSNGRVLTCIYYLNPPDKLAGGALRILDSVGHFGAPVRNTWRGCFKKQFCF